MYFADIPDFLKSNMSLAMIWSSLPNVFQVYWMFKWCAHWYHFCAFLCLTSKYEVDFVYSYRCSLSQLQTNNPLTTQNWTMYHLEENDWVFPLHQKECMHQASTTCYYAGYSLGLRTSSETHTSKQWKSRQFWTCTYDPLFNCFS